MELFLIEMAIVLLSLASEYVNEAISNNKQVTWLGIRRSHVQIQVQTHSLPRNSGAAWAMTTHKCCRSWLRNKDGRPDQGLLRWSKGPSSLQVSVFTGDANFVGELVGHLELPVQCCNIGGAESA